jgi:PHD/YefM family antitoxin component YafN of YafNO toxin-antitoxin module
MSTIVSLDEFRKNLSEIAAQVTYGNKVVRVRRHNKPGFILTGIR